MRQAWELGPFAAVLQSLALDTPLLKLQNTGTKNNPVHVQLRQIWDQKIQKRQKEKKKMPFLKSQEQNLGVTRKSRYCACPHCTQHHRKGGQNHLKPPPATEHTPTLTPYKEQACPPLGEQVCNGTCYLFSLTSAASAEAQIKPYTWISCLASSQFPLIKEGQEPWSVSIITTVKTPKWWA